LCFVFHDVVAKNSRTAATREEGEKERKEKALAVAATVQSGGLRGFAKFLQALVFVST